MAGDGSCSGEDGILWDRGGEEPGTWQSLSPHSHTTNEADIPATTSTGRDAERRVTEGSSVTHSAEKGAEPEVDVCDVGAGGENAVGEATGAPPTVARKAGPGEFELLKVIGMGAFGKVLQVRSRRNGHILAMKCISKKMLARRNHTAYMQAERDIMTKVMHPFVVRLQCAFQTEHKLFLVMEYLPGGELFFHLSKKGLFLEEYAKFYAAEMVLALEHLHSKGIIHRDLKPENLLLGANGHICLTDFGLAKELSHDEDEGLKTICGTNEYMAPEMILRRGYGKAVDWWSMGALVYEMTSGYPPFQGKTPRDLNRKILNERVSLPKWLSPTAHQVLRGFLERNVSRRLGAKKTTMFDIGGSTAVKHHAFFEGIDWAKLIALEVEPPLKPDLSSTTDTSNFSTEFVDMALPRSLSQESLLSHQGNQTPTGVDQVQGMFRGFSFVADSFIGDENWQHGHQTETFSFTPVDVNETGEGENTEGVGAAASRSNAADVGPTQQKKVKGKRIRNKKGKIKEMPAGVTIEGKQAPVAVNAEQGDGAAASHEYNAWGVSGTSVSVAKPFGAFPREAVAGVECKPSALAAMLVEQKQKACTGPLPTTSGPRRPNVWGVRELPAPAPVPTPAGPPRMQGRYSVEGGPILPGRKLPAKDVNPLPGRRSDGNTFVWKRPS